MMKQMLSNSYLFGTNTPYIEALYDAYLANFRHAVFRGWGLDALQARSRDQIRIILAGARRG